MPDPTSYCPSCGHQVAGAAFCAACGRPQRAPDAAPAPPSDTASTHEHPYAAITNVLPGAPAMSAAPPPVPTRVTGAVSPGGPIACPVCHVADALRRVSNIIDAAASTTKGNSDSLNLGNGDVTLATYKFATAGELGARLTPPGKPKDAAGLVAIAAFLVGLIVGAALAAGGSSPTMALVLPVVLPLLAVGAYYAFSGLREREARYNEQVRLSRLGYYCARDDVAFLPGGPARSPEQYAQAFAPA